MNTQVNAFSKAVALLVLIFLSLGVVAQEKKSYFTIEFGQVVQQFTNVYDGPSIQFAGGYKLNRNFGVEFGVEYSPGGIAADDFWRDIDGPVEFDNVNMLSVFATTEWNLSPRTSLFTKLGSTRGTADFNGLTPNTSPTFGRLTETNLVFVLGIARPIREDMDLTFSVKEKFSANFFALGDSFDSSTVSVGLRRRW